MSHPPDPITAFTTEALALRCAAGRDEAAWRELVARAQPTVARAVYSVARSWERTDPSLVEDLVQQAFLRLTTQIGTFRSQGPSSFLGFVHTIAASAARDHFRVGARRKRSTGAAPAPLDEAQLRAAPPALSSDEHILIDQIEALVLQSDTGVAVPRDLVVFQLHYRMGMTAAAIASVPALRLGPREVEGTLQRLVRLARQHFAGEAEIFLRKTAADGVYG
jgi:RNA polymerase sigma factor (sigma-70 family)